MINLSDGILRSFTGSIKEDRPNPDVTLFGKVKRIISPQEAGVQLDGSTAETIATIATVCQVNDRVSVLIKDHKAIVTGNLTDPASSSSESSYIRILPDGSISIGILDEHGDPVGYYVVASDEDYIIKDATTGNDILKVSTTGGQLNGNNILVEGDVDTTEYEAGENITFTENSQTGKTKINAVVDDVLDFVYPVGSIYISVNSTNPVSLFGGTWEQLQDRFLLAAGSTYSAGTTGGSADAVIVSHSHRIYQEFGAAGDSLYPPGDYGSGGYKQLGNYGPYSGYIESTGESGSGKNMPPYLAVYMWKRTA